MKRIVVTIIIVMVTWAIFAFVNIIWSQNRITKLLPAIMALPPGEMKIFDDNIFAFGPYPGMKIRAFKKVNILVPFASWAVTESGELVWVSINQLQELKKL